MADFKQAIKWMEEGSKVTRVACGSVYFKIDKGRILWGSVIGKQEHEDSSICSIANIKAEDWKIYEEKIESLSDKIIFGGLSLDKVTYDCDQAVIQRRDVKEAVKKLKTEMNLTIYNTNIINEIFGGRLI